MVTTMAHLNECINKVSELEVIHEEVIKEICEQFKIICLREQNVVPINSQVTIVGCLNGQLHDLLNIFKMSGKIPFTNYLFLGDYVNFGMNGLEVYIILMCYKVLYPTKIIMLRGQNELKMFSEIGGFQSECFSKYGNDNVYQMIVETFKYLPIAAVVQGTYLCCHGGILNHVSLDNLNTLPRVKNLTASDALTWFIIAQAKEEKYTKYFKWYERTDEYQFTEADVTQYLEKENSNNPSRHFKLLINTNSLQPLGEVLSDNKSVHSIWSATNFVGEFGNLGCYLEVSSAGMIVSVQYCAPPLSAMPKNWKPLRQQIPKAVPDFFA
ncbi:serine/threonine protein phosphatase PP2A catalytic subunit, putative [Entamoeba dispar SAW760]|uniref:protein-serine/threonine phosphatase n=1 Tax=Entamoeba dispar (strain ATCC PRA-260 / SAW760) TaxID=370354 RepID=B0E6S9_ENTDS|nr:serine/threonine protein phosphatase PP2A catalytic subunit, putative [Entamoeba dispar SAW760]XP_001737078.1 serine/threonine protein phosphatase PP2A catalytic subunit, putative [Entamoeba dispar SAW760]EDR26698.1 serine/threonine protein phosphatase PP2A catalytic subunit, putative [Entamoeba dispar SAW760]EDR29760.1 serine/threonine protein phosphatase PP2A catalytic subunit, putative [Entamoeba dispar SAW760]|eukprot:EDR26698.1 serine/threonine protein phosphatase PP2A catalytic subunit, putative [Entamoeba dispar SAW760]